MNMPWKNLHGAAKAVAICAAVLLVSGGLCGMQLLVLNLHLGGNTNDMAPIFMLTGALELVAIVVSAVVGFIALLVWGFGSLFRRDSDS